MFYFTCDRSLTVALRRPELHGQVHIADVANEHAQRLAVSVADEERKPLQLPVIQTFSRLPLKKSSKMSEGRCPPKQHYSFTRNLPTDEFARFVHWILGNHTWRRASQFADDALLPVQDSAEFAHLSEMVVRTALRENWDLRDAKAAVHNIRQMMFRPGSQLVNVARYSRLEFVDEQSSEEEQLLRISDIGPLSQFPSMISAADELRSLKSDDGASSGQRLSLLK